MLTRKRGLLITVEGGEGSGKSSLVRHLGHTLNVLTTHAPGGTELGKQIRALLLDRRHRPTKTAELLLFLADRAQHVAEVILPRLEQGEHVICDRFHDSTVAYQGGGRHHAVEMVEQLCAFASNRLQPDLTLYLDVPVEIGLKRAKERGTLDGIEQETLAFHEEVRATFLQLAHRHRRIHVLDATKQMTVVWDEAVALIRKVII